MKSWLIQYSIQGVSGARGLKGDPGDRGPRVSQVFAISIADMTFDPQGEEGDRGKQGKGGPSGYPVSGRRGLITTNIVCVVWCTSELLEEKIRSLFLGVITSRLSLLYIGESSDPCVDV